MGYFFLLAAALSLISSNSWSAPASLAEKIEFPVEKVTLENGLTVLLYEDHSVPILSFHQWFRVGSRHEKPGRTGLAHFFEHLMFKGTPKYSAEALNDSIQSNGGSNNAFTTRDYTGYFVNFPSGKLELAIDIESDRMRNLIFDQKSIDSEREVVKEERRYRVDNDVFGVLSEAVYRTVFKVHPYRWPVIGSMNDLNAATMDDMKEFYRIYYAPNNAVVVIAGDFDPGEAKRLVKKYYGSIPRQPLPENKSTPEPPQTAARAVTLERQVQNESVAVAFKSVPAGHEDAYALDLVANILATGASSRLHRRLVYSTQLASQVSAWSYTPQEDGVFQIAILMKPKADTEKALSIAYSELYKLRTQLVDPLELEKAKNQLMMTYVRGLKTIDGKARALATNEILFSDYRQLFKDFARFQAVTVEDIKRVADKYFQPTSRSVIRVRPKESDTNQGAGV